MEHSETWEEFIQWLEDHPTYGMDNKIQKMEQPPFAQELDQPIEPVDKSIVSNVVAFKR